MIDVEHLLFFSIALFCIGVLGILIRRNLLFMLLSLEIMLNAVAVLFVAASSYHGNADGEIMYLLILTLAASEVAVGLGLLIHMYRRHHSLDVDKLSSMGDANV
jgi:NADH-quinone oxidoreductase subunit K